MTTIRRANIFDPIQKELDQKVFKGITPRPRVVKFVEDEMRMVLTPLLGFDPTEFMDLYLTGSLTTYQYDDTSDFDVSVFVQWDLWPTGEDPNTIRRKLIPIVMDKLDGTMVPGTTHPIQHFVVPPGVRPEDLYKPGLRSAWSFRDREWLVPPEKDRVHDVSVELPVLYARAEMMADKMEQLLAYNPIYAKEFWHQIHRKRQLDQRAGKGDFSEGNIVYKYLLHNGYFDRIRDELGEKISKVATGLPGEPVLPQIGDLWTVADPYALVNRGPSRYTVEVIDFDDDEIWLRDVDSGKERSWPLTTWHQWVEKGRAWPRRHNWQLQQSPEEAADLWPDTLPPNWSKQAATLRLFIAFEPPEDVVAQIIQWQKQNAPEGVRLHTSEQIHMTLAFLGDTPEEHVPELAALIQQLDPGSVYLSGPTHYEEIRGKQGVLVWDEQGGNEVWRHLNQLLFEWNGYQPQYDPWLPHTTVWEYPGGTGQGYTPPLPIVQTWTPTNVGLYKSEKNPAGGGIFTKIADLGWIEKEHYDSPGSIPIGAPERSADDMITETPRSLPARDDQSPSRTPLKVIYDFEKDQIILGDVKVAESFPPGQIIGEYRAPDVYLNHHAEAWLSTGYFKRLWQHSFPKRELNRVILDKGEDGHEVVHRGDGTMKPPYPEEWD